MSLQHSFILKDYTLYLVDLLNQGEHVLSDGTN